MHQAVRTDGVVILFRATAVAGVVSTMVMVIAMRICRYRHRVLGGMKLAELGQDRLDHQPKHQQRQNAGAQESGQMGQTEMHLKQGTRRPMPSSRASGGAVYLGPIKGIPAESLFNILNQRR